MNSGMMIQVGAPAPAFDLPCTRNTGRTRARSADYLGRWLVVVFYPRDFSLVCPTELKALSDRAAEFQAHGAELLGISSDSVDSHERWIALPREAGGLGGLNFPLASDVSGETCTRYGVYLESLHVALRGLYVLDPNGVLQYQAVHNLSVGRRSDDVYRVVQALQSGGLCAENWSPGAAVIDVARAVRPGTVVSHYRVEEKIGAGSFADVYRAVDLTLERPVALKILRPRKQAGREAVLAEARAAAALNHPAVCTIYSIDDALGAPVIAMELLEGEPLSRLLERGPLEARRVTELGRQIAAGLAAAHERGVVHGDLKPGNVFVTRDGGVKILDFGLAQRRGGGDPDATDDLESVAEAALSGTPRYMAPEQAEGEPASAASDVFSFAAMLYELSTGKPVATGENVLQVLERIRRVDPTALATQTPEPVRTVVERGLARRPEARRIDMREIGRLLA